MLSEPVTLSRTTTTSDDWGPEFRIRRGQSLRLAIAANPVYIQLTDAQPPNPGEWHSDPIYLAIGSTGHAQLFGGFRFRSASPGAAGVVTFSAYSPGD